MKRQDLNRVAEEIKAALDTATQAEQTSADPELSFIPGDTFKEIARSLRRALSLIEAKPSQAEAEAELLFDALQTLAPGNEANELLCLLDESLNPASAAYHHKDAFRLLYMGERAGRKSDVRAVLRELRRGATANEIGRQIWLGTFNMKGGAQ